MYKVITFSLILLVNGSCGVHLQAKKNAHDLNSKSASIVECKIPGISADSISRLIQWETVNRFKNNYRFSTYDSFAIKKYNDFSQRGININEALKECQSYLIKKLGSYVYCNYVFARFNTFSIYEGNNATICFGFSIPNLKSENKSVWADSLLEETSLCFELPYQKDGKLVINYPKLPTCSGTKDCGFIYSKKMAIDILYKINFLHNEDVYFTELTDDFQWRVTKKYAHQEDIIKINIKSGVLSSIEHTQAID